MLTILISGIYMMTTVWGGAAWIIVALAALVLGIVLAVRLTGPRMAAIERALTTEHRPVSRTILLAANNPLLWISIQTRVAIALGIVFLMTTKPNLSGALITIGIAIVLGMASVLSIPRRERVQDARAQIAEEQCDAALGGLPVHRLQDADGAAVQMPRRTEIDDDGARAGVEAALQLGFEGAGLAAAEQHAVRHDEDDVARVLHAEPGDRGARFAALRQPAPAVVAHDSSSDFRRSSSIVRSSWAA